MQGFIFNIVRKFIAIDCLSCQLILLLNKYNDNAKPFANNNVCIKINSHSHNNVIFGILPNKTYNDNLTN